MEYATGGELFDYIVAHTRFFLVKFTLTMINRVKEKEASKFFQQIIGGIEYTHKLNIVHRYKL